LYVVQYSAGYVLLPVRTVHTWRWYGRTAENGEKFRKRLDIW